MAGKKIPLGVKILSVLSYIAAGFLVIAALLAFVDAGFIANIPGLAALGAGAAVIFGIMFLALGVVDFFIARGLWKGQNWARILLLIFMAIGILYSIGMLFIREILTSLINIVIDGLIGWYLLFNKNVKKFFS